MKEYHTVVIPPPDIEQNPKGTRGRQPKSASVGGSRIRTPKNRRQLATTSSVRRLEENLSSSSSESNNFKSDSLINWIHK